jgi:hypothetical protein
MSKKTVWDIDLLDTASRTTIARGTAVGNYPKQALQNYAKSLPPNIDLREMRDPEHFRYVFMWSKKK